MAQGQPGPDAFVFPGLDDSNFRRREWARLLKVMGIGKRDLKDLRDTYASWLLTVGVPFAYISTQLGHADVAITAKHYARWIRRARHTDPVVRQPGEVYADYMARLVPDASAEALVPEGAVGPV